MAITNGDLHLWTHLKERQLIPPRPALLEIGQANLWGDLPWDGKDAFAAATEFYKQMLHFDRRVAVDMDGPDALKLDLNRPLEPQVANTPDWHLLANPFEVVVNTGTAEHVFNQAQVFETVHDFCRVGGLMVHALPHTGWANHGFYCYQPCFCADLAAANQYEQLLLFIWHPNFVSDMALVGNSMIYACWRKTHAGQFMVPIQGRYKKEQP